MATASIVSAVTSRRQVHKLDGKVALITGGASGIGECTAKLFSEHGAKVAIADIQDEQGHSVVNSIGPSNSTFIHCDVTNEDHVKNAVDKTVSTYGKLDIMFNNAGTFDHPKPRIIDNEKSDFERVLSVNVTGVFLGMKHAARVMVPARRGTIISTASLCSGMGGAASHAYTCSKHAIVGLTRNLAVELGQFGIRVNCLSPYALATPLANEFMGLDDEGIEQATNFMANLKGTTLRVDDVANTALFLASDEAKLEGKVALITGGASGIGECTAKLFSKYVDKAVSTYGKLDIMFNNAGTFDHPKPRIIDNEKSDFERVLSVNITGVFLGMKHAARVMVPAQRGTIISTSSLTSRLGGASSHAYSCSKHAVVGLTRNLAVELGQFGIRVNCLSPYALATPLAKEFLGLDDEGFEQAAKFMGNLKGTTLRVDDVVACANFSGK
ncbi:hypothetical protein DH2020_018154 [Rehmannia glutinosa]|uniref:Uncharacterized protein n=1 Tax=Rehmannia glutinosa TaxID=99300 RepID=A0ABR0WI39_REHGL